MNAAEKGVPTFPIPSSPIELRAEAAPSRFISAHGRRGMMVGYAGETLEGWIFPFRLFHGLESDFRLEGSSDVIPGSALVRDIIVRPESVTRIYSAQNFTVRETLFVPLDEPGLEMLYAVDSRAPLHIHVSFRPDLDLMWPGGLGGQSFYWDENHHAFVLIDSSGKYYAFAGSPAAVRHSADDDTTRPWNADRRLSLELDIPAGAEGSLYYPLIFSLAIPKLYDAGKTYTRLLEATPELYRQAAAHYRDPGGTYVELETPDESVNLAYSWARVALDQALVCNPHLGCGLIAGYGPSRDTRRPQFAWFFGGDALINTFALEAAGDHDLARTAIRFIQKYQRQETGEIFHEISQSAGLMDWFNAYPYAYRHTDVSAMYLVAMANLYRSSGDKEFLDSSWDSVRAAYTYLVSRMDTSDGLVTVPSGGWGGDETIGQQVGKDIYLESIWAAGAHAMAELADAGGDSELSRDAAARAERARDSIRAKFWNPKTDFFNYGFNGKGDLLPEAMSQVNWGAWLGVFDEDKTQKALNQMAGANWLADWGLRSIPTDDPLYIGDSYGHGSVWPMGNGVQVLAFYRAHRPLEAYPLYRALVDESFSNSLGHVSEVYSGDYDRALDVCVPEQVWSSGMVITSLLRGMLGLEADAPHARLTFAPHLPGDWQQVSIHRLHVASSALDLKLEQSATEIRLTAENSGAPVEIAFSPQLPWGAETPRACVDGHAASVRLKPEAQDQHAELKFRVEKKTEVVIRFEPGVRIAWPLETLETGAKSRGLRILSAHMTDSHFEAEVEGRPGACSLLELRTPLTVQRVEGGALRSHDARRWTVAVSPDPTSCGRDTPYQTWPLRIEFTR
jgi:glycogen debranching enzyme